jgi:tRNA(fMet)-specific endonuclease VapC
VSLFVLDTDIVSMAGKFHPTVCARIVAEMAANQVATSVITVEEALGGWYAALRQAKSPDAIVAAYDGLADAVENIRRYDVLRFTRPGVLRFESLVRSKLKVKKNDLRIAAIAFEAGGVVMTRNLRDFRRVPGLACEDWSV